MQQKWSSDTHLNVGWHCTLNKIDHRQRGTEPKLEHPPLVCGGRSIFFIFLFWGGGGGGGGGGVAVVATQGGRLASYIAH